MRLKHIFLASTVLAALAGGYAQAQQSAVSNQRVIQDQSGRTGHTNLRQLGGRAADPAGVDPEGLQYGQCGRALEPADRGGGAQLPTGAEHGANRHAHHPARLWPRSRAGHHLRQSRPGRAVAKPAIRGPSKPTISASSSSAQIAAARRSDVSPAGVRQIQQALNQQGWNTGQLDGRWGPATVQAARSYQQVHGLEPTGRLEVGLISALGLTDPIFSAGHGTGPQAANVARPQPTQAAGPGGDRQVDNQRIIMERADSPGEPLWMNAEGVRQIQQVLNQRGYAAGHLDGNLDLLRFNGERFGG